MGCPLHGMAVASLAAQVTFTEASGVYSLTWEGPLLGLAEAEELSE